MVKAIGTYTITVVNDGQDGAPGAAGKNAIQMVLSNESHTLPADKDGVVTSYTGASTTVTVYEGSTNVTSQYTLSRTATSGITTTLSSATITVTNVNNGTGGTVTITATKGTTTLTKIFTISVAKAGQDGQQGTPGTPGTPGADAKVVTINPSSQIFKSTTGATGTFTPQYIYLYPTFQSCTYSKWQYSTNGTTWTNVTSGSNSLTIGTYNSVANSLRIERTCNLFTSSITSISFRCLSTTSGVYDTTTVTKVYDVVDIKIGARNLLENSSGNKGTTEKWSNDISHMTINASGGYMGYPYFNYTRDLTSESSRSFLNNTSITNKVNINDELIISGYYRNNQSSVTQFQVWIRLSSGGSERYVTNTVEAIANSDWTYFTAKGTLTTLPSATGYPCFQIAFQSGQSHNIDFCAIKVEQGNMTTTWTPAPEDDLNIVASDTQPLTPDVGTGWYNTLTGDLLFWDGTKWVVRDLSQYITSTEVDTRINNKSKVWVDQPTPPYYVGDTWFVDGIVKTCTVTRTEGNYNPTDWSTPLSAYTTVTDMSNVIGTDPSEWGTTSKSIKTLIDEANNEIASVSSTAAQLAVRASEIEMSFSITGTMNFLGNSSGQNSLLLWSITPTGNTSIKTASANEASDVRQQLVSGSSFYFNQAWGSANTVSFASSLILPPPGDRYTVSLKLKNQSSHSIVTVTVDSYSDINGNTLLGTDTLNIPQAANSQGLFFVEHMVCNKLSYSADVARIRVTVSFKKPVVTSISTLPAYNANYMGMLYRSGTTGYWGASEYAKVTIIEQETVPTNMTVSQVWKCTSNVYNGNTLQYLAGFYYEKNVAGNIVPINDTYVVTMLDKDTYYKRVPTAWESVGTVAVGDYLTPSADPIYFGDIMVNGGTMVQTWTPRQDENLWGENIKFSSLGITIENRGNMTKRTLDSTSDISYVMNDDGSIKKILWKLTSTGFIVEDILCKGVISMGYVESQNEGDEEHIVENFKVVTTQKRSSDNKGVDEYVYSSS